MIGLVFIAAGVVGLVYHAGNVRTLRPSEYALVCFVRLLAVVGGLFLLGGRNWARWLLLGWIPALLWLLFVRIVLEASLALVRVADDTRHIRDKVGG